MSSPSSAYCLRPGAMLQALAGVPPEVLAERDEALREMRETNEILETKVRKLEQLVRLKDAKIATLAAKLQAAGLS
ncbi:hypothetical protein QJQ45_020894 [Haematococcus lacustris]|nr:hypothetical protein QJQ45_020894 [Haematococcus lacustris]